MLNADLRDAGALYDTPGFAKALEDLKFKTDADEQMRLILTAKAAMARAESAERRMFVQACSPNGLPPNSEPEQQAHEARWEAYDALRQALKLNPENKEAKSLRQKIVLGYVEAIAAKLDQEKQQSLAAFQAFLSARGFNKEEPKNWWQGMWESLYLRATVSHTGAIVMRRGTGRGRQRDRHPAPPPRPATRSPCWAIRRMLRAGIPIEKIRDISSQDFVAAMAPKSIEGKPLSEAQATELCREVHEACIELGDLNALAKGDREMFMRCHSSSYYQMIKPEVSRTQFWSDMLYSPVGLLGWFLPGSVTSVNGKIAWHSSEVVAEGAKVRRFGEAFRIDVQSPGQDRPLCQEGPRGRDLQRHRRGPPSAVDHGHRVARRECDRARRGRDHHLGRAFRDSGGERQRGDETAAADHRRDRGFGYRARGPRPRRHPAQPPPRPDRGSTSSR